MFRTMRRFKQQISDAECVQCFEFTIEHMTGKLVKEQ